MKNRIIATMARSFDNTTSSGHIHLVSSIFIPNNHFNLDLNRLSVVLKTLKYKKYILTIYLDEEISEVKIFTYGESLIEFKVGIYKLLSYLTTVNTYQGLIELVMGQKFSNTKDFDSVINDVLFVFENLTWLNIKLYFKLYNIQIGGGTITKRHLLSTTHYNLSFFLTLLGVNSKDIYDSFTNELLKPKHENKVNLLPYKKENLNENLNYDLITQLMFWSITEIKNNLLTEIKKLELQNTQWSGQISSLEIKSERLKTKQTSNFLSESDRNNNLLQLTTNITSTTNLIESNNLRLSELKSNLNLLDIDLTEVTNFKLSYEELKSKYLEKYTNLFFKENKFDAYISKGKIKNNFTLYRRSAFKVQRKYSTLSYNINKNLYYANIYIDYSNLTKINNNFGSENNLLDYLKNMVNQFHDLNNYMTTLSFEQSVSIVNILGCMIILISLISLVSIFFGNSLIDSLKLEERFPRLKNFIALRLKFQRYYLILDVTIIIGILLGMIFVNILLFIY